MNTFLSLGQNAFEWTWKTSASAALLVALVFLAQKLLSRWLTPRLRYTLSLLILIRLLFPTVPASPLSLENLFLRRAAPKESASALVIPAETVREANPVPRSKNPQFYKSWTAEATVPDVEAVCEKWEGTADPDDEQQE